MELIPQIISTIGAPMPIEDPKIGRLLPIQAVLRFGNIQYDGYPILIVLPDGPLVGTCRITLD